MKKTSSDEQSQNPVSENDLPQTCEACAHAKQECEQYKTGWQRAQADYQNLQKETALQKAQWSQMIKGDILESFTPVYDNFKKAFGHSIDTNDPKQFENWKKGIEYIMKQFGDVLKQNGVEEIVTVGAMFDPALHEIVGEEESETAKEQEIVREVDGGYKSGEKVLKVAKVIVAKPKK